MSNLRIIFLKRSELNDTSIIDGQLLCCENLENYFDVQGTRVQLGNCIQKNNKTEMYATLIPSIKTIYTTKDEPKAFRWRDNEWTEVTTKDAVIDLIAAAQELYPTTLSKGNKRYAPRTTTNLIFLPDGRTLTEYLADIDRADPKLKIFTSTGIVLANYNNQTIFDIPFPITDYDLEKFPMVLITKFGIVDESEYTCSRTQVIFKDSYIPFKRDDQITFLFHYTKRLDNGKIDADYINGKKVYYSTTEPADKSEDVVWVDLGTGRIKHYINGKWNIVIDSSDNIKANVIAEKNSIKINSVVTEVEIGIPDFDSSKDTLMVYQNSTYLENDIDYTIASDNTKILAKKTAWDGREYGLEFNFIVFKGKALNNGNIDPDDPMHDGVSKDQFNAVLKLVGDQENSISDLKNSVKYLQELIESMIPQVNQSR